MSIRMRKPSERKLEISQGDWLLVRRHLTAGEHQDMLDGMMREDGRGVRGSQVGLAQIKAYLLDWSFQDPDGKPIVILGQDDDVVTAALRNIDVAAFRDVYEAITDHAKAMEEEREQEKNDRATVSAS